MPGDSTQDPPIPDQLLPRILFPLLPHVDILVVKLDWLAMTAGRVELWSGKACSDTWARRLSVLKL